jgi:hypothetical protein
MVIADDVMGLDPATCIAPAVSGQYDGQAVKTIGSPLLLQNRPDSHFIRARAAAAAAAAAAAIAVTVAARKSDRDSQDFCTSDCRRRRHRRQGQPSENASFEPSRSLSARRRKVETARRWDNERPNAGLTPQENDTTPCCAVLSPRRSPEGRKPMCRVPLSPSL